MRLLKFLVVGIFFGVVMTKSEAVSWYRIYEMFRFHSFHMYGIIGSALVVGVLANWVIKRYGVKALDGNAIKMTPKAPSIPRYLFGGIVFGLGWALTGACPGPLYVLIGNGYLVILMVLLSAVAGTFTYGIVRNKLPH